MPDWKFSEGGRWVTLVGKMGRCMKKVENHCSKACCALVFNTVLAIRISQQCFKRIPELVGSGTVLLIFGSAN